MSVESPCVRVCTLDPGGRVCLGCFRTLEEIGTWAQLSDPERLRVLERLPARRSAHDEAAFGEPTGTPERCSRCGAGFVCGANDASRPCWCMSYPPVAPAGPGARCLCPSCLSAVAVGLESHG